MNTADAPVQDAEPGRMVRLIRPAATEDPTPARLLLLHGLAGGASVWEGFAELADPAWEVWVADLPWSGFSRPGWPDRPVTDWVDRAVAGVPGGPDVIAGHSFGANALLAWLAGPGPRSAARPAGAVLVSPFYRPSRHDFDWATLSHYVNSFDRILEEGLTVSAGHRLAADVRHQMALKVREHVGPYGWMRFFGMYLETPRLPVERLRTPFLIVGGERDGAAPAAEAEALGRSLPHADVRVVTDVGHFPMVERVAEFSEAVNGFLRTITVRRPRPGGPRFVDRFADGFPLDVSPDGVHLMTAAVEPTLTKALLADTTTVRLRPRYEGSNICTWIGFKHVNYLVEEAVLIHFAQSGVPARQLYEEYGLGLDVVGLDTRILHAFHMDDEAEAEVVPDTSAEDGTLGFRVTVRVDRAGSTLKAVTSKVRVSLRTDSYLDLPTEAPAELARFTVARLGTHEGAAEAAGACVAADAVLAAGGDEAAVLGALTEGRNAYAWKWNITYPYCHFTERLQMSGYLRLMEEAKDRFVLDRGISIKTLLDDRKWIPVVPRSALRIVDEALMEEDLYTVYTVEEIFKDFTYTSRMDCYVVRDGRLTLTATGRIVHGYAVIENRRDWHLVPFDQRVLGALAGKPGSGS
ncbi:alpha/beta fold hydrolase [Streptomyces sp. NPDC005970]|uniref:alpha/beta fold hydrolase n=1 Tax=Streptomyces sp. NPDC005970 TaxID=3156723 RepID=UPI00340246F3